MRPCQAAPAFDTDDVDAAEGATPLRRRRRRTDAASVTSHLSRERGAADRLGLCLRGALVDVEQRDFGAGRRERLGGGGADGAGRAGDDGDLAGQRHFLGAAELGLLQRPVFDVEHVGFGSGSKRPIASASVMVAIAASARSAAMRASFLRAAEPEQADARHQHHARQGSSMVLIAADAGVVAGEIVLVVSPIGRDGVARPRFRKPSSLPASGAATTSGQFLVRMVWSGVTTPAWL